MAKDKKKKKKDKASASSAANVTKKLRDISKNPLVADIVVATLVGAAAALKDSKKAQRLAADAGKDLEALAETSARRGNALWKLALDVGRQSLEALSGEDAPTTSKPRKSKPKAKAKAPAAKPRKAKAGAVSKSRSAKAPKSAKSKAS